MFGPQPVHQFDETRHARRAQRVVVDLMALAYALKRRHRIVIDAVHRKHDDIRARQRSGKQTLAIFHAAVMHHEITAGGFHQPLERGIRAGAAAYVEKGEAVADVVGTILAHESTTAPMSGA